MCSIKNKAGFKKQTRLMFLFYWVSGTAAVLVFIIFFFIFRLPGFSTRFQTSFDPSPACILVFFFFFLGAHQIRRGHFDARQLDASHAFRLVCIQRILCIFRARATRQLFSAFVKDNRSILLYFTVKT